MGAVLQFAVLCAGAAPAIGQPWTASRLHPETALSSNVFCVGPGEQGGTLRNSSPVWDPPVVWQSTSASWTPLATGVGIVGEVSGLWKDSLVGSLGGHAALWSGAPREFVDLQPAGAIASQGFGVRGNLQVGTAVYGGTNHAVLWRGSAGTVVDLHPAGAVRSFAYATDGLLQGGTAWFIGPSGESPHALLWNGTAQGFVDLSPGGRAADVYGMARGVQVGDVFFPGSGYHAALWRGSAASFIDCNGLQASTRFLATTGRVHVGDGGVSGAAHSLIYFGSPAGWLDLHQFLPVGYSGFSAANAVYQDGPIIYVGGYAVRDGVNQSEAFLWIGTDRCYANCDQSTTSPTLNVLDFGCFLNAFAAGDGYANCDASSTAPVLNVLDFVCFINRFAAGCS